MSSDPPSPGREPGAAAAPPLPREVLRNLRHELRTPLNHILGYSEFLIEDAEDREASELIPALEAIHDPAQQALSVVIDLLDAAKLEAGTGGPYAACAALAPLVEEINARGAALETQAVALGMEKVLADVRRIVTAAQQLRELVHQGLEPGALPRAPDVGDQSAGTLARMAPEDMLSPNHLAAATILVVDDNEFNRDMLEKRLVLLGHTVITAENGRQALDLLATAAVDLMLLDIMMPVMNGYEVLEVRRADPRLRDVPCLVISAVDELDSVVRCVEMGAEDYLPKPFNPVLLRARIGACLEKKRLRDQEKGHLATIERQADELAGWNRTLEERVAQQVAELERLARLRRFLAPQLAEVIVSSGDESILESHRREVTVVFTDLRGFTNFAVEAEPEEVMAVLREYHQAMGELIFEYEGTLERFAGDGLMVFFNDPIPCDDHAARAVRMAVAMRDAVTALARGWRKRGYQLGFGVGIAQGYATLGKVGFEGRFDYAAIGTVTNTASRLCDEAQSGQILLNGRAYLAVEDEVEAEPLDALTLKGLGAVPAYNVRALKSSAPQS
jgi:class 3 adenylate cyclase/CheY-like chemotaxis protein